MKSWTSGLSHIFLLLFSCIMLLPIYFAIVAASHAGTDLIHAPLPLIPGSLLWHNIGTVFGSQSKALLGQSLSTLLFNSAMMASCIALGKIILAVTSAFALTYFDLPYKRWCFAIIFSTMMLPVEVRIVPTFQLVASLTWINTYSGLTFPLMASATATFLFRQFFNTLPRELVDAATLDGAGPWRYFWDIAFPLSRGPMAALFFVLFVYGWNQYLWPLVAVTDSSMSTVVMGIRSLVGVADQVPQWQYIMTIVLIGMLPPCLVVLSMQKSFEGGVSN